MKLKSRRLHSIEELWAIEDEFPCVCGPSPISYANRYGLKLSKRYLQHLDLREKNGNDHSSVSSRSKTKVA